MPAALHQTESNDSRWRRKRRHAGSKVIFYLFVYQFSFYCIFSFWISFILFYSNHFTVVWFKISINDFDYDWSDRYRLFNTLNFDFFGAENRKRKSLLFFSSSTGMYMHIYNHHQISFYIIIIIIIIMSCHRHGYPWPSLATSPYHSSPPAGLQGYIPYSHIAAECMFMLVVLLLPSHMWGSIGVHHLWARPCFSSSVLHVWLV